MGSGFLNQKDEKYASFKAIVDDSLTEVTANMLSGITTITDYAFAGCQNLESVTIPGTVNTIDNYAFSNCSKLSNVVMQNGVTSIGDGAFYSCFLLSNIVFSNAVTTIGSSVFRYCRHLNNLDLSVVTSIGEYGLSDCAFDNVTLPRVTNIGDNAFSSCSALTSITISSSITLIGSFAFSGCYKLSSVTVEATTPPSLGNYVFSSTSSSLVIYVPSGSVETYKTANNWSTYADKIQAIPSS